MTAAALLLLCLRLTGLVAIAAIAVVILRRAAAAEHHFIWMMSLGGALFLPFAHRVLPDWRIMPAVAGLESSSSLDGFTPQAASERVASSISSTRGATGPLPTAEAARTIDPPAALLGASEIAIAIWALGTLLCLIRLTRAHTKALRIVREAHAVRWHGGGRGGIRVLESRTATGPFTYGLLHPSIIMPADASTWTEERRDAVLTHETAHALRHDGLWLLVTELACAVYWWHPAVLFAGRRAAIACERACDDAVIRESMRASDYGAQLLAQAQSSCAWGIRPLATTLFGPSRGIAARIAALLDPRVDRRALTSRRATVLTAVSLGTLGLVAAAAPTAARSKLTTQSTSVYPLPQLAGRPTPAAPSDKAAAPSPPPVSKPRLVHAAAFAPGCVQAEARYAKTLKVDSTLSFSGAGSASYADGSRLLVWTGVDCAAWLRVRGPVMVDASWSVISVSPGAEFVAHDEGPAGRRDYVVGPASASLSINGSTVPVGAEHRDWIAMMILEYVRRTGLDATARSRAIVAKGGATAILDEARRISVNEIRVRYLEAALPIVPRERRSAFVHDAASLLDSATARANLLLAIPREWLADEGVLAAVYTEARVIEPDAYVEQLLRLAPPPRPLTTTIKPLVEQLIASLQSIDRRTALSAYYLDVRP